MTKSRLRRGAGAVLGVLLVSGLTAAPPAASKNVPLPLGDDDLVETRTVQELAPGVTLTHISRGTGQARPQDYNTTSRGPWQVKVVTIDPAVATGSLRASYGVDLADTEAVSEMAAHEGALAAVNASFFSIGSSDYPGDPVGLGVYGGDFMSEPLTTATAERNILIDSRTSQVRFDRFTWEGRVVNRRSRARKPIDAVNHPPFVPAECIRRKNPTRCRQPGEMVLLTKSFSRHTPEGQGVEVILNRRGCVKDRAKSRGTQLRGRQTSLQATGRDSRRLWRITRVGCLNRKIIVRDSAGARVRPEPWLYAVNGRFMLTSAGQNVVPNGQTSLFHRNPRTFVGRTSAGQLMFVTIDGRQPTSVGASLRETADVALALGMPDALNLDGGGSTTMVTNGAVTNSPSGGSERAVGDALVYLPTQ